MRTRDQLLEIMDGVCADVRSGATGADEVPERLIVVASGAGAVERRGGIETFGDGGVVAFVNDSGVPLVEQADQLAYKTARLKPEAVLLGGTAITGRAGGAFRRVLAVQLFSAHHGLRIARVADVEPPEGAILTAGPWRATQAGPRVWAEDLLHC